MKIIQLILSLAILFSTSFIIKPMDIDKKNDCLFTRLSTKEYESKLNKLIENFSDIQNIHEPKKLHKGFIEVTFLMEQAPENQELTVAYIQQQILKKRLSEVEKTDNYIFEIPPKTLDILKSPQQTSENYQNIISIIKNNNQQKKNIELQINKIAETKKQKTVKIDILKQQLLEAEKEEKEAETQLATQSDKLKTTKVALGLLCLQAQNRIHIMKQQEKELKIAYNETYQKILTLNQELSNLKIKEEVIQKKNELSKAQIELGRKKQALQQHYQLLNTAEKNEFIFQKWEHEKDLLEYIVDFLNNKELSEHIQVQNNKNLFTYIPDYNPNKDSEEDSSEEEQNNNTVIYHSSKPTLTDFIEGLKIVYKVITTPPSDQINK